MQPQVYILMQDLHHVMQIRSGLNIFYSSQDMIKDQAEQEAMFSPHHDTRRYKHCSFTQRHEAHWTLGNYGALKNEMQCFTSLAKAGYVFW